MHDTSLNAVTEKLLKDRVTKEGNYQFATKMNLPKDLPLHGEIQEPDVEMTSTGDQYTKERHECTLTIEKEWSKSFHPLRRTGIQVQSIRWQCTQYGKKEPQ